MPNSLDNLAMSLQGQSLHVLQMKDGKAIQVLANIKLTANSNNKPKLDMWNKDGVSVTIPLVLVEADVVLDKPQSETEAKAA